MHVLPGTASKQAAETDDVYNIMLVVTGGIFGLVTIILVAAVFTYRQRRGETRVARPIHGHTGLEFGWIITPTIIVAAFTGISWAALRTNDEAPNAMHVNV